MAGKPDGIRQQVLSHVSPSLRDLFFWEYQTVQRKASDGVLYTRGGKKIEYDTPHYNSEKFPNHFVVHFQHDPTEDGEDQNFYRYRVYYAARREFQDDYNFSHADADIGDQRFEAVTRTYVIRRDEYNPVTPAMGAAMSQRPDDKFSTGFILAARRQARFGQDSELDSMFVVETRVFIKRVTINANTFDEATQGPLFETETLFYRGEEYSGGDNIEDAITDNSHWGLSAAGVRTTARQLTDNWFLVTATDMIPQNKSTAGSKFGGKVLRTYNTHITYYWPPVLSSVELMDWEDKDGGTRIYPRPVYSESAYRGPCRAVIVEEWSPTAPTITGANGPVIMKPEAINYNSPYLSVNLGPTLHDSISFQCDTAATDPTWGANVGSSRSYGPTNYTSWPASIIADVTVTPFRGGFLTRHVTVYQPTAGS